MTRASFSERMADDRIILMDGALNTELSRKGLEFDSEYWLRVNVANPQAIGDVHADYAKAGAEVHIANSFANARHALAGSGLEGEFEALNRAAITVCREYIDAAAPHDQWIAGSISTFAAGHDRRNLPEGDEHERNVTDQAEILADAGAELFVLEMVYTVEQAIPMLKGAMSTGLPVSIGLVCAQDAEGRSILGAPRIAGEDTKPVLVSEAVQRIFDACPPAEHTMVTPMHSELEDTGPALAAIASVWDGPKAVYPNTGRHKKPAGWDFDACCEPSEFVAYYDEWLSSGIDVIGGCCGIGPAHIRALAEKVGH